MPNFGGSRGGFWFRPPSVPTGTVDRSTSSKRILLVKEYGEKTAQFPRGRLYGVFGGADNKYTHNVLIQKYPYVTVPNSSDIYASTYLFKNPYTNKIDTYVITDYQSAHAFAIKTCAEELGYTVDIITCHDYDALSNLASQLTNINTYSQIWDLQFIGFLNTTAKNVYKTFLQAGGSLFLTGENISFGYPGYKGPQDDKVYYLRNDDISTFMRTDLGGGEVYSSSSAPLYNNPNNLSDISSEFRLSDANMTSYAFNAVGAFSSYRSKSNNAVIPYIGTGTVIVQLPPGFYNVSVLQGRTILGVSSAEILIPVTQGAMWKTGSLANAPAGACIIIFDSTFQQPQYLAGTGYTKNANMIKNMILSLNSK
jgi:hypothetical protein